MTTHDLRSILLSNAFFESGLMYDMAACVPLLPTLKPIYVICNLLTNL